MRIARLLLVAFAVFAASAAQAQQYPSRPITLVVPFPPGGQADIFARQVGEHLRRELGQPVVVENRAGAGTAIGGAYVARAAPDGYTLILGTPSLIQLVPRLRPQTPFRGSDFAPVALITRTPHVLITAADTPYHTLAELVAAARARPGGLNYGTYGLGSTSHMVTEMFQQAADFQATAVHYAGAQQAITDLLAGRLDFYMDVVTTALPNIQSGRARGLAITSDARSAILPDVPSAQELGLPNAVTYGWYGILAPAAVPPAIIQRLNTAINGLVGNPDFVSRWAREGVEPEALSPEAFASFIQDEGRSWEAVIAHVRLSDN